MIFDFSDGDFIFPMNDKMGMDMNGEPSLAHRRQLLFKLG